MTTRPPDAAGGPPTTARDLEAPAPGAPDIDLPSNALWLQQIFRHNTRAIAIADWNGRFELCNDAYQTMLGYPEDELRGMDFSDVVHPDDRSENLALTEKLRAGEIATFEVENRSIRKDGTPIWVHKFVSVLPDRTGAPAHLVAMITDIDERKRFEQETQEKAALLDLSNDAILVRGSDDRIEYWNQGAEALYGYRREDVIGRQSHTLLQTRFPVPLAVIESEIEATGSWSGELVHRRADGSRIVTLSRWQATDSPSGRRIMETNTDITERKRVETELRASEERFRATFEYAPVGVAHVAVDGRFLRVNDAFVAITRRTRAELEQLSFHDITHPDDLDKDVAFAEQLLRGEVASYSMEKRYVTSDGTPFWINLTRSLVRTPSGEPDYFVAVIEEISARHEAAEQLRRAAATERDISLRLQHALLPTDVARAETLQVAANYSAVGEHLEVGGDWYDAIPLPDGRICFVVGDVVGHGLDAAAVMGRMRAGLAALAAHEPTPGALLTALDQFARSPHGTDFATISCAFVDPASGAVEYSSAGHPPMLIVDTAGDVRWLDGARSAPLATVDVPARPTATDRLAPGSLLLAYSDGLVERRGRRFIEGLAELRDAATRLRDAPIHQLCDRLVDVMTQAVPSEDDVVVLAVRYDPEASTTFRRAIPADPSALAPLRAELRHWLADRGIPTAAANDVLLGVGEAGANAIEHAYAAGTPGTVEVLLDAGDHRAVEIEVRDHGAWRAPSTHSPDRGRGTAVITAVSEAFARRTGPGGTVVRMRVPTTSEEPQ